MGGAIEKGCSHLGVTKDRGPFAEAEITEVLNLSLEFRGISLPYPGWRFWPYSHEMAAFKG